MVLFVIVALFAIITLILRRVVSVFIYHINRSIVPKKNTIVESIRIFFYISVLLIHIDDRNGGVDRKKNPIFSLC